MTRATGRAAQAGTLCCCIMLILAVHWVAQASSLSARVELQNGESLLLHSFRLDGGPLRVGTGDAGMTVRMEDLASIAVRPSKPGGWDTVDLTLVGRAEAAPCMGTRKGTDHIWGVVVQGDIRYTFHTKLSWCKSIVLSPETGGLSRGVSGGRVSCVVTTIGGASQLLCDVRVFHWAPVETGYVFGIGRTPLHEEINEATEELDLFVATGVIRLALADLEFVDFGTGTARLRGGAARLILKRGAESPFKEMHVLDDALTPFSALAGWSGREYVVVSAADLVRIAQVMTTSGSPLPPPERSGQAAPVGALSVTDRQGKMQALEGARIESPCGATSMGRVVMNARRPSWHIAGDGESVECDSEFLDAVAVKRRGCWSAVPLSQVQRIVKTKQGNVVVVLSDGRRLDCSEAELGTVQGSNVWGQVRIGWSSLASLEVRRR